MTIYVLYTHLTLMRFFAISQMANPFEGMDDDQKEYQKAVAENVNKRMEKAMGEIKARHANGTAQVSKT